MKEAHLNENDAVIRHGRIRDICAYLAVPLREQLFFMTFSDKRKRSFFMRKNIPVQKGGKGNGSSAISLLKSCGNEK